MLAVSLGIALASPALFGVSLALGAFLAGVVVSESPLSHQVGADVLPFREAFAVLFFVSVGMLVDPARPRGARGRQSPPSPRWSSLGKALAAVLIAVLLRQPLRTGLVVGAGLSQIGEFSFILGPGRRSSSASSTAEQYSLLLSAALVSITLNPLMFGLVRPAERALRALARCGAWLDARRGNEDSSVPRQGDHVVIVGWGRVGGHIVEVLGRVGVPRLVVEADVGAGGGAAGARRAGALRRRRELGDPRPRRPRSGARPRRDAARRGRRRPGRGRGAAPGTRAADRGPRRHAEAACATSRSWAPTT